MITATSISTKVCEAMTLCFYFPTLKRVALKKAPKGNGEAELVQFTVESESLCCHHSITIQHSSTNLSTRLLKRLNEFSHLMPNVFFFFFFVSLSSWRVIIIISLPENNPRLAAVWSAERFMRRSLIRKSQKSFGSPCSVSLQTIVWLEASVLGPICRLFESGMAKIKFPGRRRVLFPCANTPSPHPEQ